MVAPVIVAGMAAEAGFKTAELLVNGIVSAIRGIYGIVGDTNDFLNDHIEKMTCSENPTRSRTGRVIEGAKAGFGICLLYTSRCV